jgi:uncharacterized protein
MTYMRATDPFPLESAEHTKLHEFYARLAGGRLSTTACAECRRRAWPPRGFCPDCGSDRFDWVDLPETGVVHAYTAQEVGLPAGFDGPRVFAIVKVDDLRIFSVLLEADPARVRIGDRVRFTPLRVADDPRGTPRFLPAFTPCQTAPPPVGADPSPSGRGRS